MFYNSFQSAQAALEKVSGLAGGGPHRPAAGDTRGRSATPRAAIDFSGVEFRYGDGPVVLPTLDLHIPAGQTVAARRPDRSRQVHARQADRPLLRRHLRVRSPWTAWTCASCRTDGPAPERRHGHAGGVPVQRLRGGQHRPGPARRPRRAGDRGCRPGRRGARVHPGAARGLRHRRQQARRPRLRRAAAADQLRPGLPGPTRPC